MTSKPTTHPDHEHQDIRVSLVARSAIALIITVAITCSVVWWMYGYMRSVDEARDVRRTLIPAASAVPPDPRLQVDPPQDLQKYKREQEQILNSYGWVSREQGRVRIPVERAMDLIVQRGLPALRKAGEKK